MNRFKVKMNTSLGADLKITELSYFKSISQLRNYDKTEPLQKKMVIQKSKYLLLFYYPLESSLNTLMKNTV